MNEVGFESGNEGFTEGRDLPWLQDTSEVDVWNTWEVVYRDVLLLDREGQLVGSYNLSDNDLGDPVAMDQLRSALEELAAQPAAR